MAVYTYSYARYNFSSLMDMALKEDVIIARRTGPQFRIVPVKQDEKKLSLDIEGIHTAITMEDILDTLNEVREGTP
jgi:antitoxin (DNA-binding transcriptional repressor) of toxin-antitoxin stability system